MTRGGESKFEHSGVPLRHRDGADWPTVPQPVCSRRL